MPIPRNHSIDHPFLGVLKRVVLQRNPKATAATRADVRQTLQFFEVPHILKPLLRDIFPIGRDRRPPQESFDSLMRTPMAAGVQIGLETKVRDWINTCEREALQCLRTQSQTLNALVNALLINETLDGDDVARIVQSCCKQHAAASPTEKVVSV